MGKKAKPEIEVHEGIDAVEAFRALLNRLDSGESELAGVDVHGFDEDDDDLVLTVWLESDPDDEDNRFMQFEAGPALLAVEDSPEHLRWLAEAMTRQVATLLQRAQALEDEANGE